MTTEKPCILLLNDIHISKDNIPEFTVNWNEALQICENMGIREIAFGGDMFQSRSAQTLDVLLAVHDALLSAKKKGIHITLANGNHDKINQESDRGYCHIYGQHDNVLVADEVVSIRPSEDWDFVLHLIAYFPENGSFRDKLEQLVKQGLDRKLVHFLYIHAGVNGALSQPNEKELPPNLFKEFDKVFVGHYHNRCVIPNSNVEFIGSSRQHNFGEDEAKGYTVIYTDGRSEFIPNQVNVRYRIMDVKSEELGVSLLDEIDELNASGHYKIKVRIHSTQAQTPNIDKEKLLNAGASKVEIITENPDIIEHKESSLLEKFDHNQIVENYKSFCQEKDIADAELGLSYLLKIK